MALVRVVADRLRDRSPSIRDGLERSRRILRRQVLDLFEPDLDRLDPTARRTVTDALEMVTSYGAWRQWRQDQGLSVPRSSAAMKRSIESLLGSSVEGR